MKILLNKVGQKKKFNINFKLILKNIMNNNTYLMLMKQNFLN